MKLQTVLIVIVLIIAWFSVSGFSHRTEKEFKLNLSAENIEIFEVHCGSGYLKIKGVEGLNQVEVKATLVVKGIDDDDLEEFKQNHVELTLEKTGRTALLISKIKSSFSISSLFKGKKGACIDLDIRIPKHWELDIDDGSGFIEVYAVNSDVKLDDGSGSITMGNIKGKVSIDDGSGSTVLEDIGGNVKINDGSGSIKITGVGGDVNVDDNSGSIGIYNVKGSVRVDDGSGGIYIDGVDKDVYIKNAGSGSLNILNVNGTVKK